MIEFEGAPVWTETLRCSPWRDNTRCGSLGISVAEECLRRARCLRGCRQVSEGRDRTGVVPIRGVTEDDDSLLCKFVISRGGLLPCFDFLRDSVLFFVFSTKMF